MKDRQAILIIVCLYLIANHIKLYSIKSVIQDELMMKRALLYIVLTLGNITSIAQIIEAGESNPIWGVRAAFDVNLPGKVYGNVIDDRMFRNGTGGTIGAVCNIFIGNKFYLESAVSLFYDTYSYNNSSLNFE